MLKQPISQDSKSKLLWDKAARVFNLKERQRWRSTLSEEPLPKAKRGRAALLVCG